MYLKLTLMLVLVSCAYRWIYRKLYHVDEIVIHRQFRFFCGSSHIIAHVCSGAGAGIARRFAREGYKVALVSRRQETIEPIERELKAAGATTLSVPSDAGTHALYAKYAFPCHVSLHGRPTPAKRRHDLALC